MRLTRRAKKWRENYIDTLAKLYEYSTGMYAKKKLSAIIDSDEQRYTYASFRKKCDELSARLSRYGVSAGDRVAILSQNMPNWTVAMFSVVPFGRIVVPILPDSSENEVTNILTHSGCKVLFVSQRLIGKVSEECMKNLVLVFDIETFDIIRRNDAAFTCDGKVTSPLPDDLAAIIYTSGTTGSAKGVMLSHRNIVSNVKISYHCHKCTHRDSWLSVLPMPHTYELSIGVLYPLYVGACVYYLQKPPTPTVLVASLKKVRPTTMLTVPLIIEKVYKNSVVATVSRSRVLTWMQKRMPRLLYWFIGMKLKATFGGHIRFFGIGGAKLDSTVEDFLRKAHFPYAIGYGMTECAPLICTANPKQTWLGSTGGAAWSVDVRLDNVNPKTGEGEIVVKGENVMLGYYKDPERTLGMFTKDGYIRTGDLAVMDKKGRFYIKGRIGNMIVGPSGENIYPEEIEKVINDMEGVQESIVMERNGRLVALVHFDDNVIDWNQESEDKFFEKLEEKKKAILNYVNRNVSKSSKVGEVEVVKEPFEKTATMKIRRFKYKNAQGEGKHEDNDKKK